MKELLLKILGIARKAHRIASSLKLLARLHWFNAKGKAVLWFMENGHYRSFRFLFRKICLKQFLSFMMVKR